MRICSVLRSSDGDQLHALIRAALPSDSPPDWLPADSGEGDLLIGEATDPLHLEEALRHNPAADALILSRNAWTEMDRRLLSELEQRNFFIASLSHPRIEHAIQYFLAPKLGNTLFADAQKRVLRSRAEKKEIIRTFSDSILTKGFPCSLQSPRHFSRITGVVLEELLLNAIVANPDLAGRARNAPFYLPEHSPIEVVWGCLNDRLALMVRDPFGSLTQKAALRSFCGQKKEGPGGVGLRFVLSRCESLYIHVRAGIDTKILCILNPDGATPNPLATFRREETHSTSR